MASIEEKVEEHFKALLDDLEIRHFGKTEEINSSITKALKEADSKSGGLRRLNFLCALCLYHNRSTVQRDQPVLIRRQPDSWFLRKRGRPKSPVQPPAFCGSADQRYLLCGI